jgi:6-phosphogluconolactonase
MVSSMKGDALRQCRWHGYATMAELEQAAAREILRQGQEAVQRRSAFRLVLAGGATPRGVYGLLRETQADWGAWHIYFGDERCLPPEHPERNSRMAAETWLNHVAIPRQQIHAIPAEQGAELAATAYAQTLSTIGEFDLVLLGLGDDGHTASLFPGHTWGEESGAPVAIAVHNAPKPPPDRVSLSAARLSASRAVFFLVSGETKRRAVADWRSGKRIPASVIVPMAGVDIFLGAALLR